MCECEHPRWDFSPVMIFLDTTTDVKAMTRARLFLLNTGTKKRLIFSTCTTSINKIFCYHTSPNERTGAESLSTTKITVAHWIVNRGLVWYFSGVAFLNIFSNMKNSLNNITDGICYGRKCLSHIYPELLVKCKAFHQFLQHCYMCYNL